MCAENIQITINMLSLELHLSVCFIFIVYNIKPIYSDRKIIDGHNVETEMRFMVYLTISQKSPVIKDDAWICGGAIVTSEFIVTSAACVEDAQYMYAIAGYNKYVSAKDIDKDPCTKASRKKVVFICVPKILARCLSTVQNNSYEFSYDLKDWAFIDIAAVKVESPYDFASTSPLPGCSWVPGKIDINYDPKYQLPDTDAMILGWGHTQKWRLPGDSNNYNQEILQWSPILIMNTAECEAAYQKFPEMIPIIQKYMICALNEGNINEKGEIIRKSPPKSDGCQNGLGSALKCANNEKRAGSLESKPLANVESVVDAKQANLMPFIGLQDAANIESVIPVPHVNNYPHIFAQEPKEVKTVFPTPLPLVPTETPNINILNTYLSNLYSHVDLQNPVLRTTKNEEITFDDIVFNTRRNNNVTKSLNLHYTRKAGICQNDHGGPMVTWVGKHEVLIGVASVFRLNKTFFCDGPFLFTSTQCNGAFLDCVLNSQLDTPPNSPSASNAPTAATTLDTNSKVTESSSTPVDNTFLLRLWRRNKKFCELPPEQKGFDVIERKISWRFHPDGPAENELAEDLFERPTKLLNELKKQ